MSLSIVATSAAPGSGPPSAFDFVELPTAGGIPAIVTVGVSLSPWYELLELELLRLRTTARTIATMTTMSTPPAMPRTFGDAWRTPPAPVERTGGGAATAAWRCCLALLPL